MRPIQQLAFDLFLIAVASIFALFLRDNLELSATRLNGMMPYIAVTLVAAAVVIPSFRINRSVWRFASVADCGAIIGASVIIVLAALAGTFAFDRLANVARSYPIIQALLIMSSLLGVRLLAKLRSKLALKVPQFTETSGERVHDVVVVVGMTRLAELFIQSAEAFAPRRVRFAGVVALKSYQLGRVVRGIPVVGLVDDIDSVISDLEVHGMFVNRVVVAAPLDSLAPNARRALLELEAASSAISVEFLEERLGLAQITRQDAAQPAARPTAARASAMGFRSADLDALARRPYWRLKRAIDFCGALVAMILALPIMIVMAIAVAIDVGIPILFWQVRPGVGGHAFKVFKFRTMRASHDASGRRLAEVERTSAFGRMIRKSRLDELPQLYNILTGDMSFIGPRPLLPVDQPEGYAARLCIRPGLTGWAQVHGGREVSADDKAAMDIWYVHNASFWLDAKIVLRTLPMLILGERVSQRAVNEARQFLNILGAPTTAAMPAREPHGLTLAGTRNAA